MASFTASLPKDELVKSFAKDKSLQDMNNGTATKDQINTWLGQDYLFGVNYIAFLNKVVSQAPKEDHEIWKHGISLTEEKIAWIKIKLKESNILVENIKPTDDDLEEEEWLNELIQTKKSYLALLTAFYALELGNYEEWKVVKNANYQGSVTRWTSADVTESIEKLKTLIDKRATTASEADKEEARQVWDDAIDEEDD
jgi:thiaminase